MSREIFALCIEDLAMESKSTKLNRIDVLQTGAPVTYRVKSDVTLSGQDSIHHVLTTGTIFSVMPGESGYLRLTVPANGKSPEREFQIATQETAKLDDTTDIAQAPSIPFKHEAFHVTAKDYMIVDSDDACHYIPKGSGFYFVENKENPDQFLCVTRVEGSRDVFCVPRSIGKYKLSVFDTNTLRQQFKRRALKLLYPNLKM